jgi:hypothetical protein
MANNPFVIELRHASSPNSSRRCKGKNVRKEGKMVLYGKSDVGGVNLG